jgi:hypothetical protein
MPKQELYGELYTLLRSLANSLAILFRMYGPFLKPLLLLLLGYLGFKLGRRVVVDPLEEDTKKVRGILENRAKYVVQLPQRLVKVGKIRKIMLVCIAIAIIVVLFMFQTRVKMVRKMGKMFFVKSAGLLVLSAGVIWIYEILLSR